MKSLILLLTFAISSTSFAIRHVGSGGGESELRLWQFAQFLPLWAQGCNTNPDLCWNGGEFAADFQLAARGLKLTFANQSENKDLCGADQLTLTHEELYWDHDDNRQTPDISKTDTELATILVKSLLTCQGSAAADLQNLIVKMVPQGRALLELGVFAIEGIETDLVFQQGSSRNLHAELTDKMQCPQYKVTATELSGFILQCKNKPESYLVIPHMQNGELILNVRYNADLDF